MESGRGMERDSETTVVVVGITLADNTFEDDTAGDVATRDARQRKHGCGEECRSGTRSQEEEEAERKGTRVPAKGTWTRKTHPKRTKDDGRGRGRGRGR